MPHFNQEIPQNSGIYTASELAAQSTNLFGVPPEFVAVPLKLSGCHNFTLDQARQIIADFLHKEVL